MSQEISNKKLKINIYTNESTTVVGAREPQEERIKLNITAFSRVLSIEFFLLQVIYNSIQPALIKSVHVKIGVLGTNFLKRNGALDFVHMVIVRY